jgi:hypothetical protein
MPAFEPVWTFKPFRFDAGQRLALVHGRAAGLDLGLDLDGSVS